MCASRCVHRETTTAGAFSPCAFSSRRAARALHAQAAAPPYSSQYCNNFHAIRPIQPHPFAPSQVISDIYLERFKAGGSAGPLVTFVQASSCMAACSRGEPLAANLLLMCNTCCHCVTLAANPLHMRQ